MTYYNTNSEVGEQLNNAVKAASVQDNTVYNIVKSKGTATAWHIYSDLLFIGKSGILITSIRRSLNTLEKNGKVRKVQQVKNHFGRKEWTWQAI